LIEGDAETPLLHIAFHAGKATDPDALAMNVLLNILVGGNSSRLHLALVEERQVALSVGGFNMEGFDPGLAYFYLTLPPGADAASVEEMILAELEDVAENGVSEAELTKARNIMIADYWRDMSTIDGKASQLGNAEVFLGDYQRAFLLPDELQVVSSADLQAVAAKVFRRNNMTVGVLQSAAPAEDEE